MDETRRRADGLDLNKGPFSFHRSRAARFLVVLAVLTVLASFALASPADAPPVKEPDPAASTKLHIIVLPVIYYTPETRLAFGAGGLLNFRLGKEKKNTRPSSLGLLAIYTLENQVQLSLRPEIYLPGNAFVVNADLKYDRFPQNFYGIGNDVSGASESYTPGTFGFKISLKRKIFGSLFGGVNYQFENTVIQKVKTGGMLDSGTIPGSEGGVISGLGISLNWDDRDNVFFPRRGSHIQLAADFYSSAFGSDYSYSASRLDLRTYIPLFETHVLALQGYVRTIGGGAAPFYELSMLGGPYIMRGTYTGQYRDNAQLTVQAEYRFPVWRRLSAAGFTGVGNVAPTLGELLHTSLKFSVGGGFRFRLDKREGTNVRLDFAWCGASTGLYMTIQEAF
jgi:hypothetical protein